MAETTEPSGQHTARPEPLWRVVLGARLRRLRHERGETLADTAERAGVSPQYLSEIERGRKEPSSEMIAAVARALGTTLVDLTIDVSQYLGATTSVVETSVGGSPSYGATPAAPGPVTGLLLAA
jgi:transcriptional regulator with XRE-family HTH domain